MKIKGKLSYKSAIIIDKDLLENLDVLLSSYFGKAEYSAVLENGDKVVFDSVCELIEYDNFESYRLKTLSIVADYINTFHIEPSLSIFTSYGSTVEMEFIAKNNDECEEIKRKVRLILDKHRQSKVYTILSKLTLMQFALIFILVALVVCIIKIMTQGDNMGSTNTTVFIVLFLVGMTGWFLLDIVFKKIMKKCFPPIVFYVGENIKKVESEKSVKNYIFWGIIVAFAVSIVSQYLFIK